MHLEPCRLANMRRYVKSCGNNGNKNKCLGKLFCGNILNSAAIKATSKASMKREDDRRCEHDRSKTLSAASVASLGVS